MANKIVGKVVGGILGFGLGGPVGALLGYIVGHMHDSRRDYIGNANPWEHLAGTAQDFMGQNQQSAFTLGVIVLGAKMAKADGRVTRAEVEAFKRVFNVQPHQEASVGRLFDQARGTVHGFEPYALHLAGMFRHNRVVLEEVLGGLFVIAASDSPQLSPHELRYLQNVAGLFGFTEDDFVRIAARAGVHLSTSGQAQSADHDNYAILGVSVTSSADEIKAAYRALIREHHPDKLVAQGMPAEFVATATEKMKRINHAYDMVCKQRGIR